MTPDTAWEWPLTEQEYVCHKVDKVGEGDAASEFVGLTGM